LEQRDNIFIFFGNDLFSTIRLRSLPAACLSLAPYAGLFCTVAFTVIRLRHEWRNFWRLEGFVMGELDSQAYMISAFWDAEAAVWVASSDDVPGLVTEADTMEQLVAKLKLLIPDLLEANGILPKAYDSVPFHLHTEMNDVAAIRAH